MSAALKPVRRLTVEANLALVHSVAQSYRWAIGGSVDYDDLVQAGSLGLMRAIEKFEPERGFTFSTYATYWVRQALQRLIANQRRTIRVPIHALDKARRRGAPVPLNLASLDTPTRTGDRASETWLDRLVDETSPPEETHDDEHRRKVVAEALERLPTRTRGILVARFFREQRLEQIAGPLGISRERVRQLIECGLSELRESLAGVSL